MGTNGTDTLAGHLLEDEVLRVRRAEEIPVVRLEPPEPQPQRPRSLLGEGAADLALAPLIDKIAYGLARGLVVALKELETHIANETRNVGDSVGRRLDTLQASFQDLTDAVSEQRSVNFRVQETCDQLSAATAMLQETGTRHSVELESLRAQTQEIAGVFSERADKLSGELARDREQSGRRAEALETDLRGLASEVAEQRSAGQSLEERFSATSASLQEADVRQAAELGVLRSEAKEFAASISDRVDTLCKELGVQQEDMAAVKSTIGGFSSRVDTVVERLDRQADALRSMYSTYAQRETELEQLVDGLARLRAYPAPQTANRL